MWQISRARGKGSKQTLVMFFVFLGYHSSPKHSHPSLPAAAAAPAIPRTAIHRCYIQSHLPHHMDTSCPATSPSSSSSHATRADFQYSSVTKVTTHTMHSRSRCHHPTLLPPPGLAQMSTVACCFVTHSFTVLPNRPLSKLFSSPSTRHVF